MTTVLNLAALSNTLENAHIERSAETEAKVMVNGDIIFTIVGGPIQIWSLHSECISANNTTASTMQYQSVPTVGTATAISGASTTLASIAAGATVLLTPTALSTAPTIILPAAGGVQLGLVAQNKIIVNPGTIKLVIGTGSTTGTWKHFLRYKSLGKNVSVY